MNVNTPTSYSTPNFFGGMFPWNVSASQYAPFGQGFGGMPFNNVPFSTPFSGSTGFNYGTPWNIQPFNYGYGANYGINSGYGFNGTPWTPGFIPGSFNSTYGNGSWGNGGFQSAFSPINPYGFAGPSGWNSNSFTTVNPFFNGSVPFAYNTVPPAYLGGTLPFSGGFPFNYGFNPGAGFTTGLNTSLNSGCGIDCCYPAGTFGSPFSPVGNWFNGVSPIGNWFNGTSPVNSAWNSSYGAFNRFHGINNWNTQNWTGQFNGSNTPWNSGYSPIGTFGTTGVNTLFNGFGIPNNVVNPSYGWNTGSNFGGSPFNTFPGFTGYPTSLFGYNGWNTTPWTGFTVPTGGQVNTTTGTPVTNNGTVNTVNGHTACPVTGVSPFTYTNGFVNNPGFGVNTIPFLGGIPFIGGVPFHGIPFNGVPFSGYHTPHVNYPNANTDRHQNPAASATISLNREAA